MLDALINRQDRNVTSPGQPSIVEKCLHAPHHVYITIRICYNAIHKITARKLQIFLRDCVTNVSQERLGLATQ